MNNYINYNWMRSNNGNDFSINNNLLSPKEAFIKGNLYRNLYNSYKNYEPQELIPKSEKEKCLYELSAVCFAAHELNLYLDLHPEDQSMFLLFRDYEREANHLKEEYEQKYGPLCVNSESMSQSYSWVKDKWPWEGQNV